MNTRLKLGIIRGLPGSGKSTLANQLVQSGEYDVHYEADMFFEQSGTYMFDHTKLEQAHEWCQQSVSDALACGQNVVVSNTFTMLWEILPYIDLAILNTAQVKITTLTTDYGSIHGIPATSLEKMRKRFLHHDLLMAGFRKGLYCDMSLVDIID